MNKAWLFLIKHFCLHNLMNKGITAVNRNAIDMIWKKNTSSSVSALSQKWPSGKHKQRNNKPEVGDP